MSNECLTCIYRGNVPNSVHSSCRHPIAIEIISSHDTLFSMMKNITNESRLGYTGSLELKLDEEYREYAIDNGYFIFPINYDPRWISQCKGYKAREVQE